MRNWFAVLSHSLLFLLLKNMLQCNKIVSYSRLIVFPCSLFLLQIYMETWLQIYSKPSIDLPICFIQINSYHSYKKNKQTKQRNSEWNNNKLILVESIKSIFQVNSISEKVRENTISILNLWLKTVTNWRYQNTYTQVFDVKNSCEKKNVTHR